MVQEKQIEAKMDFPNVLLYAMILCVYYPLRIWFKIYKLARIVLIKIVSFPKQFLVYTIAILNFTEELLEKWVINFLTHLATIPSYLFETAFNIISYPLPLLKTLKINNKNQSNQSTNVEEELPSNVLLTLTKRAVNVFFVIVYTFETYTLATVLLPIKILVSSLKITKNVIYTTLNTMETETNVETTSEISENQKFDYVVSKEKTLSYENWILTSAEYLIMQIFDLIYSTFRHLYKIFKKILNKSHEILLLSILVFYSIGEYLILSFIFLFSILNKFGTNNNKNANTKSVQQESSVDSKFELERQNLRQEITNLKDSIKNTLQKNENYNSKQQVIDLQKELKEANAMLDKERARYKQEIEKLQYGESDDNVQTRNNFNNERKKLQDEILQLQKLIAEVQKENEEENKLKKQEAIDLDNERNQLQEQIQNLQLEVVVLQKQNENNALMYEESLKEQKDTSIKEQSVLEEHIKILEDKVSELERIQKESKPGYLNNNISSAVQINNTDDDKTGKSRSLSGSNKKKKTASKS